MLLAGKNVMPVAARERAAALQSLLGNLPEVAVAFSGGLDSRFLCHAALLCGCRVVALHAHGPHVPRQESLLAQSWARQHGLHLLLVDYNPLPAPEVAGNSRQRCYGCKRGLVAALRRALARWPEAVLCDGTNADDVLALRPGLRALAEGGVRSPLAEAGMSKEVVRVVARGTGLDRPDQRARPCLLTRLAYGLAPREDLLLRLARAEEKLESLGGAAGGLGDLRLRLRPEPLLQAEFLPEAWREQVEAVLQEAEFWPCEVRVGGSPTGFFDA